VRTVLIGVLCLAALAGCGSDPDEDGVTKVVATTPQLADIARNVAGEAVEVETLLEGNVDPHDYEPRPSDAKALAEADVILRSGGEVDAWLGDLVDSAGVSEDRVIDVGAAIGMGRADPHWWQNPDNVVEAVKVMTVFGDRARAAAYTDEVHALTRAIDACMRSIPRERRRLVTNHDAFEHFADRFGIEILGTIIPGGSTAAQPSARDVRELVGAIRRAGVTTIFPESALRQDLEEAVARDAGAKVGEPLYADTLGPAGTYLGALRHDAAAMARGFGGDCDL
jgi:ABC-type Zn uptake system ZnuABC Zn-binding protein ZnuA